jgi:hypothetical protein
MRRFQLLSHRVDGRGGRDWLAAAFAKNAAPHKVSRRAANTQCAMGVSLSAPEPEPTMAPTRPHHGPGQPATGVSVWKRNCSSHRRAGELQFT